MFANMLKVKDLLSNITPDTEVLLFIPGLYYKCVEHYPFTSSALVGCSFPEICEKLDVHMPLDCHYAFFRFPEYNCTIKENGNYVFIINSKIQLSQHGQNS